MKTIKYIIYVITLIAFLGSDAMAFFQMSPKFTPLPDGRKFTFSSDSVVLDYAFKDLKGRDVRLSDFKGKFILVDLWYSGCGFCISANKALYEVHKQLAKENIIFLSISTDSSRAKWIESITLNAKPSKLNPWAGKYVPAKGTVMLYTGGSGMNNDFIQKYNPNNFYPKLLFIAPSGKLISDNPPRPDSFPTDEPEKLVNFIKRYLNDYK